MSDAIERLPEDRITRTLYVRALFVFYFFGIGVRLCAYCNHFIPHNKKEKQMQYLQYCILLCVCDEGKKNKILLSLY